MKRNDLLNQLQAACRAHTARQHPAARVRFNPTLLGQKLREFPRHVRRVVTPSGLPGPKAECERCGSNILKVERVLAHGWLVCPACAKGIL